MAATDLLTSAEAEAAINLPTAPSATVAAKLTMWVSGLSQALDEYSGDIVQRSNTETIDGTDGGLRPLRWPVASITSVTEYVGGSGTPLTAEAVDSAGDYRLKDGRVFRRSGWTNMRWYGQVVLVYVSGRFVNTAAVEARYKTAAEMALQRMWNQYAAAWARGGDPYSVEGDGFSYFRIIEPVAKELGLPKKPLVGW